MDLNDVIFAFANSFYKVKTIMLRKCYGIKFKTKKKLKTQKDKKTSFPKEKDRKSRLIQIGIEENNDHTRVMPKIRF